MFDNCKAFIRYLESIGFITIDKARLSTILRDMYRIFRHYSITDIERRYTGCRTVTVGFCYDPINIDLLVVYIFGINILNAPSVFTFTEIELGLGPSATEELTRYGERPDKGILSINNSFVHQRDSEIAIEDDFLYVRKPYTPEGCVGSTYYRIDQKWLKDALNTYRKYNPYDCFNVAPQPEVITETKLDLSWNELWTTFARLDITLFYEDYECTESIYTILYTHDPFGNDETTRILGRRFRQSYFEETKHKGNYLHDGGKISSPTWYNSRKFGVPCRIEYIDSKGSRQCFYYKRKGEVDY